MNRHSLCFSSQRTLLCAILTFAVAFAGTLLHAADPLPVMARTKTGQSNPGFLAAAEADGLVISTAPQGGNSVKILFANIDELNVEEPPGWAAALLQLNAGNYSAAEKTFATFADDYANLIPWKDGYGSLARLYHFKSLKGLGKLGDLAAAMDRQLAKPLVLGELSLIDLNDLRGWAILGKGDLLALQSYLNEFQEATASKWSLQPAFKPDLPARFVSSLAYLRGHLHEKQQRPELALIDFHQAMTYNYGSDRTVFAMACLEALKIASAQASAKPGDLSLKKTAHSLAVTYRDCAGRGQVPAEFTTHLEPIPEDKPVPKAETPESSKAKGPAKGKSKAKS
jgi:hypothetical protein